MWIDAASFFASEGAGSVTGQELIEAGYRPGPAFKAMLVAAEDAQLEGEVTTREEALAMLRQKFGPPESSA